MESELDDWEARARELAAKIHAGPLKISLVVTGGGSLAGAMLLTTPGASKTVLEFQVPYSMYAAAEYLGKAPESYCSSPTARALATAALERARRLYAASGEAGGTPIGIAATCALSTGRERRGADRIHLAVQTLEFTRYLSLTLAKGSRDRLSGERLAAGLLLNLLAEHSAISPIHHIAVPSIDGDEWGEGCIVDAVDGWRRLREGESWACLHRAAERQPADEAATGTPASGAGRVIFPGSFHPHHAGHAAMAEAARKRLGKEVEYEISLRNVDKPPLDYLDLEQRLAQFRDASVWFTDAPRFTDKARIFPGATFVVGADTIERIGDPKYYSGRSELRDEALAVLEACGAEFLVFGRVRQGAFQTLDELPLPATLRARCQGVSAEEFRVDLSSTELRAKK